MTARDTLPFWQLYACAADRVGLGPLQVCSRDATEQAPRDMGVMVLIGDLSEVLCSGLPWHQRDGQQDVAQIGWHKRT